MTCLRSIFGLALVGSVLLTVQSARADELVAGSYPGQISIAAFVTAPPGKEKEFMATFAKFTQEVRAEPGCVNFDVHQNSKISNRFFVYENFKDQAAFDQHVSAAHTKNFVQFLNSSGGVLQFENWTMVTERRAP
ncbi:antibiotic biosynthesis monooxygenase [Bradyrhizobium sp. KB893862 SZCCT0404]|uniref:putative quinol monooxygenase n=1 Tax=Bradyrhizobium sp. KB893862 SZCCT0404 TaxID=2807672 RepID=UPI001BACA2AF|nr:putative quinol monooxygenase [Bradyrhizobium sp. KB893862 SZCCT0404]MBR1175234.1 antibiotic biosynthesis monooxygenase [Bradyrhizobium sp. KB893862 SZCCT0404]